MRKVQERTGETPEALRNRPTLLPHLRDALEAFWSLCGDRGGDGSGPILFTALDAYARRHRIGECDPDDFDRFEALIRAADAAWLEDLKARRDRDRRAGAGGNVVHWG
jgi:hypothetical protein